MNKYLLHQNDVKIDFGLELSMLETQNAKFEISGILVYLQKKIGKGGWSLDWVTYLIPPRMGILALPCTFPTPANDPLLPTGRLFFPSLAPSLSNVPLCCKFSHFYSTSSFLWPLSSFHTEAHSVSPPLRGNSSLNKCVFSTRLSHTESIHVVLCVFTSFFWVLMIVLFFWHRSSHVTPAPSYLSRLLQPTDSLFM